MDDKEIMDLAIKGDYADDVPITFNGVKIGTGRVYKDGHVEGTLNIPATAKGVEFFRQVQRAEAQNVSMGFVDEPKPPAELATMPVESDIFNLPTQASMNDHFKREYKRALKGFTD